VVGHILGGQHDPVDEVGEFDENNIERTGTPSDLTHFLPFVESSGHRHLRQSSVPVLLAGHPSLDSVSPKCIRHVHIDPTRTLPRWNLIHLGQALQSSRTVCQMGQPLLCSNRRPGVST
jgi:hypothetical protein